MKKFFIIIMLLMPIIQSHSCPEDEIEVKNLWARPTAAIGKNSAIYLEIINNSEVVDNLLSATSDVAEKVELHKTIDTNGVKSMIHLDKVAIPAKNTIAFVPGGLHIMLLNVNKKLEIGDKFYVEFVFEKSGEMQLEVVVKKQ